MKEKLQELMKNKDKNDKTEFWLIAIALSVIAVFFILWLTLLCFGLMAMSGITDTLLTQLDGVIMTAVAIIIAKWS